jgi:DNA-binding response OmpR family regulator
MTDGHGWFFIVYIPYTRTITMTSKPIILVVDDDLPILALMRTLLREFGFEAVTAENGEQAIAEARARKPSAALIDRNLPGMTGDEIIRALRKEPGMDSLPILIISGQAVSSSELASLGADGAILKPFDITELINQLRSLVPAGQSV